MNNTLSTFPLEETGFDKKPQEFVIFGMRNWKLTVRDVYEARQNRSAELERLCIEFGIAHDGDATLLRERVAHHIRFLKSRAKS